MSYKIKYCSIVVDLSIIFLAQEESSTTMLTIYNCDCLKGEKICVV